MGKTYCILGGGGAFGIHCALYLLQQPDIDRVEGVGRSPMRPAPFSLGVTGHVRYNYHQIHVVSEFDLLMDYLDEVRPDVIINFAAQGEGAASWTHSWRFFDTNATALVRLYEALSQREWFNPHGRFVQIGTSELYGSVDLPAAEDAPVVPSSPYAASKAAFDSYLLAMASAGRGAPMNIIRPSNCYCPGQLLHRIVPRAIVAGLCGRRVPLHGGGRARKSYLHARDLARAIHLVACGAPPGRVYNVGPTDPISIRDLAQACADTVGQPFEALFEEVGERLGQDGQYWLNSSAVRCDVGWRPEISLETGLADVRDWAVAHIDVLRDWPTSYQLRA